MASIIPRENGTFLVRYEKPKAAQGRRNRGARSFGTRREAEEFLWWVEPARHRGLADGDFESGMTSWIRMRLSLGAINAKTAERQFNIAANWGRVLGGAKIIHVATKHIEDGLLRLQSGGAKSGRGLARRTVRHHRSLADQFLTKTMRSGWIDTNPLDGVEEFRIGPKSVVAPANADIDRLLELAKASRSANGLLHLLLCVLRTTGMRRGEAMALGWSALDFAAGTVRVACSLMQTRQGLAIKPPKTAAGARLIETPGWLCDLLLARRAAQAAQRREAGAAWAESDFVFTDALGGLLMPDTVSGQIAALKRRAGFPEGASGMHGLRHRFGTTLSDSGVQVRHITVAMGHADPAFTLRTYVHPPRDVVRTAGLFARPDAT
jgi:integrase